MDSMIFCKENVPSGVDIYKWVDSHPNTTFAATLSRISKIFDSYDEVMISISGGKDSSLSLHLAVLELKRRRELAKQGDKSPEVLKWVDKKLWVNTQNPEWLYSDALVHLNRLVKEYAPFCNTFYKCLQIGWSSGVTFGNDSLTSWDPTKKSQWISPMPSKSEIGCDIITNESIKACNQVSFDSLPPKLSAMRAIEGYAEGNMVPNFGLGNVDLNSDYPDAWTFPSQNESYEQESFAKWFMTRFPEGTLISNIVSLRADESYDRYTILRSGDYSTGKYASLKYSGRVLENNSPVMDVSTTDLWRIFSLTDFSVSELYDKLYQAGIAPSQQRVASLLHVCAVKNISQIRSLEPDMYMRIISRFQNIEMLASFSNHGYYQIEKPKDDFWNGSNHIKAGYTDKEVESLSDSYENKLEELGIEYTRINDSFLFDKKHRENFERIHFTWKDYCLYLLNTSNEPGLSSWRNKMVSDILNLKFRGANSPLSTVDALKILSELDRGFVEEITDDIWTEDDWTQFEQQKKSKRIIVSVSKYPQESLEKEALMCISEICKRKDKKLLQSSPTLMLLAKEWRYGCLWSPKDARMSLIYKDKLELQSVTGDFWKDTQKGANIWFKENIHSTSSWKRFAICILQNDIMGKYIGFTPTYGEKVSR